MYPFPLTRDPLATTLPVLTLIASSKSKSISDFLEFEYECFLSCTVRRHVFSSFVSILLELHECLQLCQIRFALQWRTALSTRGWKEVKSFPDLLPATSLRLPGFVSFSISRWDRLLLL
ncbi:hypothetical protein R1flu_022713 [Riccia fluitans]|uniref:Uncharacterized protein n=1 Tax=Riccia fluitans TaxID=41844 RepID=A0ABD1XT00_9MARC